MHIYDLFTYKEHTDMIDKGYVRENDHPYLPIRILNYTEKAQYDNEWNDVTRQTRGLIVDDSGNVISRPFDKFMNYGQNPKDSMLLDYPVEVTDKLDGSLGIFWQYQGEQGIATRGSFTSDQAIHATKMWNSEYRPYMGSISTNWTYMFEIIYPENRIVLNYGDLDDLDLLGARNIQTGRTLSPDDVSEWSWKKTTTFPYKTLREVLEAPQRPNAEGFVVYCPSLDYRIKLKQDDYVALHKIVTGLTKRRIWEIMGEGKTLQDMCQIVPDEWHDWLQETVEELEQNFLSYRHKVRMTYRAVIEDLPIDFTRKDFALYVKDLPYRGLLFKILDGGNVGEDVWKAIKPSAE